MSRDNLGKEKVYAILNQGGEFLLVQEAIGRIRGLWGLPGGGVKSGETLTEALKREVREEVGYTIEVADRVHIPKLLKDEYVRYVFTGVVIGGDLKPDYDELMDAKWFTSQDIRGLKLRSDWIEEAIKHVIGVD